MMMGAAAKLRSSKRRRNQRQKVRKRARVRRRWQQRRAGDIKPEDFTWWRLINKHDVTDVNSRNGKVCNHCVCVSLRFVFWLTTFAIERLQSLRFVFHCVLCFYFLCNLFLLTLALLFVASFVDDTVAVYFSYHCCVYCRSRSCCRCFIVINCCRRCRLLFIIADIADIVVRAFLCCRHRCRLLSPPLPFIVKFLPVVLLLLLSPLPFIVYYC